ncbi:MAG: WD40 repeat domain-containing protein, partial [Planctomycetota bacterium]
MVMFIRPGIACCLVVTALGAARAEEAPSCDEAASPAPPTAVVRIERAPVRSNRVGPAPTFCASGRTVAALVGGGELCVWTLAGGRWRYRLGDVTGPGKVSFSPSGAYIAGATDDGALRVWEAGRGSKTLEVGVAAYALTSATFAPDDASLATVGRDGTIHVWDIDRREVVLKLAPSSRGS